MHQEQQQEEVVAQRLVQLLAPSVGEVLQQQQQQQQQQQRWQDIPTKAAAAAAAAGCTTGGEPGVGEGPRTASAGSASSSMSELARLRRLLRKGASAAVWAGAWQEYVAAEGDGAGARLLRWALSAASAAGSDVHASGPAAAGAAAVYEGVEVVGGSVDALVQLVVGRLRAALLEGGRV
jgi:hypothetical protein